MTLHAQRHSKIGFDILDMSSSGLQVTCKSSSGLQVTCMSSSGLEVAPVVSTQVVLLSNGEGCVVTEPYNQNCGPENRLLN